MSREILFRAKHVHALPQNEHLDGTWVYGYLCDENYINTVDEDEYGGKFISEMLIDSETVCQYTGLTDKNGRKIFEGDITKDIDYGYMRCMYKDGTFVWYNEEGFRIKFMTYIPAIEVIGNIFDNPELIRGKGE